MSAEPGVLWPQDAIAAALAEHDYETNVAATKEIEELMEITRMQLNLLQELRKNTPSLSARGERSGR